MNDIKIEDIVKKIEQAGSYESLIEATGCEIIDSLYMGSYQGDLLMVVSKNYKFGILSTGFGSCSGCDALQACNSVDDTATLAKRLHDNIVWKEPEEIIDYFQNKDWGLEYYGKQDGLPEFIDNVKEQILIRYLARI